MKRSISNCYSRCTVRRWDCCKVLWITLVIMCIIDSKQHRTVLNHKWMSKTHWCGRFPFGVSTLLFMLRIHTWCSWVVLKYNHASFQSMLTEPHPFYHQPFDCWILAGGVAGGQLNQLRSCTSNQINGRFSWVSQCGNAGYVSGVLSWMDVAYISVTGSEVYSISPRQRRHGDESAAVSAAPQDWVVTCPAEWGEWRYDSTGGESFRFSSALCWRTPGVTWSPVGGTCFYTSD